MDAPHAEYDFRPLTEFLQVNNEDTLAITQIERKAAIENIDAILSVTGVDVAFVGPEVLSVSMGVRGDTAGPIVREAVETMIDSAQRNGVVHGIHVNDFENFQHWHRKGMRFFMYGSDLMFLMQASAMGLRQLRGVL